MGAGSSTARIIPAKEPAGEINLQIPVTNYLHQRSEIKNFGNALSLVDVLKFTQKHNLSESEKNLVECFSDNDSLILLSEISVHVQFCDKLQSVATERKQIDKQIFNKMTTSSGGVVILSGTPGSGKSTIIASVVTEMRKWVDSLENKQKPLLIYRFIGSTSRSTTEDTLIADLWQEIRLFSDLNIENFRKKDAANDLLMCMQSVMRNLIIVLDGIDVLFNSKRKLDWLIPILVNLPKNVNMVLTTSSIEKIFNTNSFNKNLTNKFQRFEISQITQEEEKKILSKWNSESPKPLTTTCENLILSAAALASEMNTSSPMLLRLLYEITLQRKNHPDFLSSTTAEAVEELFTFAEITSGSTVVSLILSLITISRDGISRHEIAAILCSPPARPILNIDFGAATAIINKTVNILSCILSETDNSDRFVAAKASRFICENQFIQNYPPLLFWSNKCVQNVAQYRYFGLIDQNLFQESQLLMYRTLEQQNNSILRISTLAAEYFLTQPTFWSTETDQNNDSTIAAVLMINVRKIRELPRLLRISQKWKAAVEILSDFWILRCICAVGGGVRACIDEIESTIAVLKISIEAGILSIDIPPLKKTFQPSLNSYVEQLSLIAELLYANEDMLDQMENLSDNSSACWLQCAASFEVNGGLNNLSSVDIPKKWSDAKSKLQDMSQFGANSLRFEIFEREKNNLTVHSSQRIFPCGYIEKNLVAKRETTNVVALSPFENFLLFVQENYIFLWDLNSLEELWKKDLPVKSAAFSRNGQILAVSDGNTIQLINAMLGAPAYPEDLVKPDGGHLLSDIEIIHFNCDLMHVLSCCGYTEAYHWNLAKPKCDPIPTQLTLKKHPLEKFQNRFSFSPNQQLAVWWRFSDKLSTEFVEFCCATVVATQSDIKFSEKWSLSAEPFLIVSFSSDSSKILTCSSKKITAFKTTDGSTVWARNSEEGLTFKSALFSWDTSTTIAHLSNGKLVVYRNSSQSDNTNSKTIPLSESVSRIALLSKKFEKLLVLSIDSERVNLYLLKEAIKISQSNEEKNSDIVRHIAYTEVISTQSTTNKAFADGAILMVSDSKIQIKDFRTGRNIKSITIAEIDSNIENSGLQDYLTFASFVGKSNEFLVCKTKMGNVIGYSASEKSFGKEIFKTKFPENAALLKVVTSYMHNIVVISSSSKIVGLDISKKGKLVWEIQNNVEEQSSPVVTTEPLSNWLLVAFAKSGKIQICDLSTGEVLQVLSNDIFKSMPIRGTLLGCAVSPCRSEVILSDNLGTCYILTLNPPGKGRTFSLTGIEGGVKDVSTVTVLGWCYYPMVKQQSRIVLGLCSDGFIRAWDLKEQQPKIKASMKVCALDGSLESLYLNVARKCEKLKSLLDTEGLCIVAGNGSGIFTELTLKQ